MKHINAMAGTPLRKARTRTLIQLGSLVEKAGLFESLGIIPGADLQKDPLMRHISMALLGALLEIKDSLKEKHSTLELWHLKAQKYLNELSE